MALLAESLVEEWLNRNGYFTIRGVKASVEEMDLLAVRDQADGVVGWHVEVQISFRPVGYIAKRTDDMIAEFGGARASARARTPDQVHLCGREWVAAKFRAQDKVQLRERLWRGVAWSFHLVHAVVRELQEMDHKFLGPVWCRHRCPSVQWENAARSLRITTDSHGVAMSIGQRERARVVVPQRHEESLASSRVARRPTAWHSSFGNRKHVKARE